jgi:hypothetical protein
MFANLYVGSKFINYNNISFCTSFLEPYWILTPQGNKNINHSSLIYDIIYLFLILLFYIGIFYSS